MKVSLITVSYNSENSIEETIQSVISQTYKNIEYIIIDGGSADKTVDIIEKYKNKISYWISEKDTGIYNAMNKGLMKASGDIVGFINADDYYSSDTVISEIVELIQSQGTDSVYADLYYVDRLDTNKIIRFWKSGKFNKKTFFNGKFPAHPTFYVKREIYNKYGFFIEDFRYSADFELMLRFLVKNKISTTYLEKAIIEMRLGGESNSSVTNIVKSLKECYKSFALNNLKVPFMFYIKTLLFRFFQVIKK